MQDLDVVRDSEERLTKAVAEGMKKLDELPGQAPGGVFSQIDFTKQGIAYMWGRVVRSLPCFEVRRVGVRGEMSAPQADE